MSSSKHFCFWLIFAMAWLSNQAAEGVEVKYSATMPELKFAGEHVESALKSREEQLTKGAIRFLVESKEGLHAEGFAITREGNSIVVTGADAAGAMYGGLELAEQIRMGGLAGVKGLRLNPAMGMRGIKFNIPLDVRTPSYSDMGDAAQFNLPFMWDLDFWKEFIDEMARHRYNFLSLWSLHPFPSLVKVPEYPEVALDDVKRALNLERKHYHGRGEDFDAAEILDETETLLEMTIDEKIAFWRKVMAYGKSRHVDFYFLTWNIFDYGAQDKYGIDDSIENKNTIDYFRKSVKQLFLTYPDLRGIGITTGENMHGASAQQKEDWMLKTYGQGVLDVVKEQPRRKITFLHRQHQAGAAAIATTFKPLLDHPNIDFIFSYKYAKAHSYSSTRQPFYREFAKDISKHDRLKTIWTMRNDSTYQFRWAAPDFMRAFVQNIPMEITRGYYFGADGWVWGREFTRKGMTEPGQLELKKHWLQWLLWGRLAYDPKIGNERFAAIVQARFPSVNGARLLKAWQQASMVYPITTGFHWGALDYHWYPEACLGVKGRAKTGFHDVESFIKLKPHPGTDNVAIPNFVKAMRENKTARGTGPDAVSRQLLENADKALAFLSEVQPGQDAELAETLKDIAAMAHLGRYYGHKIAGATQLHLFREAAEPKHQQDAIDSLAKASQAWRDYTSNLLSRYKNHQWLSRIRSGVVDWEKITEWVDGDIDIARQATPPKNRKN